jgi:glutamyl-tRNA synthetase
MKENYDKEVITMDYQALAERLFPNITDTPESLEEKYPLRDLPEGAVVTRMAPSPTGFVHLGNLVQGLTAERMAHQSGGVLFLRVEDTDAKREVPGAVEVLIDTLKHYGIQFDEGATKEGDAGLYGPYRQRQRAAIYHVYAKKLVAQGMAYPCFCTEEELAAMREKQEAAKETTGYYGKYAMWRDRSMEDIQAQLNAGNPWVLRFRSEGSIENQFKFDDLVKGKLTITENDVDHVLLKSDGIPTYHFAHAVDDHLMRTTHVVRGDEWLPTLPFHIQLFKALDFKLPKYVHIGPLMKMDGNSKRKLSKRKDPELALTYYKAEGFPVEAVYEYIMTLLNSNYEDWRRANPTSPATDFKFSPKKLNPAGNLFDYAKLTDVSKNEIAKMDAQKVYTLVTEWATEFDPDFAQKLKADPDFAKAIFAIGRGGKKPRKDLATWVDAKPYMGFFYDDYLEIPVFDEKFDKAVVIDALNRFLACFDINDDSAVWFDKVKAVTEAMGFTTDMKAYKADPDAFPGTVADVSTFIRQAVTGKTNSPDLYTVMQILGYDRTVARIRATIAQLS